MAIALGIPSNILFSEAANYATAKQDKLNFYTDTIVPRCEFIEGELNRQLFVPMGVTLKFLPDTIDIFQEDENERSESVARLVQAGFYAIDAADILGLELTDEQRAIYEAKRDKEIEAGDAARERLAAMPAPGQDQEDDDEPDQESESLPSTLPEKTMQDDLDKWRRKALNSLKRGKGAGVGFSSDEIPHALAAAIEGALDACETPEDVKSVFEDCWIGYP